MDAEGAGAHGPPGGIGIGLERSNLFCEMATGWLPPSAVHGNNSADTL